MEFSQKKIEELKKKHDNQLFLIEVEGGKSCILHAPTRKDLSFAAVGKDPMKVQEALFKALWVEGDQEILDQDDLFLAACSQLEEVIKVKEAKIKKL